MIPAASDPSVCSRAKHVCIRKPVAAGLSPVGVWLSQVGWGPNGLSSNDKFPVQISALS